MESIYIKGGAALRGAVDIGGSKNAALPILYATLIVGGVSRIDNLPDIKDVNTTLDILRGFGAEVTRDAEGVTVNTDGISYSVPSDTLVSSLRASSYLLGAALAAFGKTRIQNFGGCNFDNRPIDMHLGAICALGGRVNGKIITAPRLIGQDIVFPKISVGATVNAMLLAAVAKGETNIYNPATEPHISALADFLNSAGADVEILEGRIRVVGRTLAGARARVIPDMIEAGTYLICGLASGGEVTVRGVVPEHLGAFLELISSAGASVSVSDNEILASADRLAPMKVVTAPYPHFPTDLQPQTAALMAAFSGGSITEGVWHNRFGYLSELAKLGVRYDTLDGGAIIYPSTLHSAKVTAPDLRTGAAEVILALAAEGESVIENASCIRRGYSDLTKKLRSLGAQIEYK
ncbi:MAG: UDP-N-acetylglucosamine 1-carboxyvinyltransferase [Clostridia bacterium]|nr:UDP-N-acetylglucosamine 1-carboxyvinyltransferase [Clostridia bacterium]